MKKIISSLAFVSIACMTTSVFANTTLSQQDTNTKTPIVKKDASIKTPDLNSQATGALKSLVDKHLILVEKKFSTNSEYLTGFVVKSTSNGQQSIIYQLKDGDLINGYLINDNSENLTKKYFNKYVPKPDYSAVSKVLSKDKHLVVEGKKGAPTVYAFADPNCYYCHKFYKMTRELVNNGEMRIKWVMVGFLKSSSAGKAAAIMDSKNPLKMLDKDENNFNVQKESGGVSPEKNISAETQKVLNEHSSLMHRAQINGTPGILYINKKTGKTNSQVGMGSEKQLKELLQNAKSF